MLTARSCLTTSSSWEHNGHRELGASRSYHLRQGSRPRRPNYLLTFKHPQKAYNRYDVGASQACIGESRWLTNLLTHLSLSPSMKS